jgi:UDP-N-acetylglucosamine--N-acetylmuramyl-(pentapeptide) pyrophosphoryl-undecaprenol N-acetylglucosamine transferase
MASAYAQADIVICRAGCRQFRHGDGAGVASVLVPLVVSTTSHQRDNAQWMAKQGASIHMPQTELTPESLAALLQTLNRSTCQKMAAAALAVGKRDANDAIAQELEALA